MNKEAVYTRDVVAAHLRGTQHAQAGPGEQAVLRMGATLRRIPVVVLTTSDTERDIARSYDLHANCYITNPVNMDQFIEIIKRIEGFGLTVVKLPKE